jgi:hypothetical protein
MKRETGSWVRSANRMSRLVRIPTRVPSARVIGTPEIRYFSMIPRASARGASGPRVIGFMIIPLSERLTLSTSSAWRSMERFLWTIPIPPSWARAMASSLSVTVSMAAERRGMLREILRVSRERTSTSRGWTSLRAGIRRTSSKVNASPVIRGWSFTLVAS